KVIPSLELIVKRLGKDPARVDVQAVGTYLHARQLVQTILDRRAAVGGARTLEAEANRDLALIFATLVNRLAMENTYFSDYALPGLIEKDPMYMPELIGEASG